MISLRRVCDGFPNVGSDKDWQQFMTNSNSLILSSTVPEHLNASTQVELELLDTVIPIEVCNSFKII